MQITDTLARGLIAWFDPKCSRCLWPIGYFNERVFTDLVTLSRYDNCRKTTAWFVRHYKCFNCWIKGTKVKECKKRLCCSVPCSSRAQQCTYLSIWLCVHCPGYWSRDLMQFLICSLQVWYWWKDVILSLVASFTEVRHIEEYQIYLIWF